MKGKVSNIISAKQFGFISGENGQEYFFHKTDFNGDWEQFCTDWRKATVSFEPKSTPKGPRAANVTVNSQKEMREI